MINKYVFYRVFQIIEELEERIIKISQIQNVKYQKEISKMKLKYEIMARNQVNQRFSEMNEELVIGLKLQWRCFPPMNTPSPESMA